MRERSVREVRLIQKEFVRQEWEGLDCKEDSEDVYRGSRLTVTLKREFLTVRRLFC
jgi:hypothetical protein